LEIGEQRRQTRYEYVEAGLYWGFCRSCLYTYD
jgi:hypothetical protein